MLKVIIYALTQFILQPLSGYLITSLLQHEYTTTFDISFRKFYARRAIRLFPPLIICLVLANILWSWSIAEFYPGFDRTTATLSSLFYFANLVPGALLGNMAHLWSLSVEEHFYFFWPLLLLYFILKTNNRNRVFILLLIISITSALKIYMYNLGHSFNYGIVSIDLDRFTFYKIEPMVMGALLAFIPNISIKTQEQKNKKRSTILILSCLSIFLILLVKLDQSNKYWNNGGFVLTNLLCTVTVLLAIKNPTHYLLSNNLLTWFGKRSYGIYVYHFPIFLLLERLRIYHSVNNLLLVSFLRISISILLAAISYKFMEQPILKYKKRYATTHVKLDN